MRRTEDHIDAGEARAEMNDRIREIFDGRTLDAVAFPGGPFDVADEVADGRPKLVVLGYEAVTIGQLPSNAVPELIERIFREEGIGRLGVARAPQQFGLSWPPMRRAGKTCAARPIAGWRCGR